MKENLPIAISEDKTLTINVEYGYENTKYNVKTNTLEINEGESYLKEHITSSVIEFIFHANGISPNSVFSDKFIIYNMDVIYRLSNKIFCTIKNKDFIIEEVD